MPTYKILRDVKTGHWTSMAFLSAAEKGRIASKIRAELSLKITQAEALRIVDLVFKAHPSNKRAARSTMIQKSAKTGMFMAAKKIAAGSLKNRATKKSSRRGTTDPGPSHAQ